MANTDMKWDDVRDELERLRQKKETAMRVVGFTANEAEKLSNISFKTPYIKDLIKDRRALLRKSVDKKISKPEYFASINEQYYAKEWVDENGEVEFWAMVRWYAKKGETKYPDWKTPHPKKVREQKDYIEYEEKWEARGQKYPPGYGNTRSKK